MATAATTPDRTELAGLQSAWDEFFSAIRRAKGRAARQHGTELTLPQLHLLEALDALPGARCGELAEAAGIAAPTASRMIDSLERAGIVTRRHSTQDRRAVTVSLTAEGRRQYEYKRALHEAKRAELFSSLSDTERANAEHLLRRLGGLIEEM